MRLYTYFRSSAAYRVRIALCWKGVEVEHVAVDLLAGEHRRADFTKLNPEARVPALVDGSLVLTQSLAILEYLEEKYPAPPLLPDDLSGRARVRQLAQIVACDVHPLQNLGVVRHLGATLGAGADQQADWQRHWTARGLDALECWLADGATGRFCHGDAPTLADVCLVPQLFNARRFGCPLEPYPTVRRIDAACAELEAFRRAAPDVQPDAQ